MIEPTNGISVKKINHGLLPVSRMRRINKLSDGIKMAIPYSQKMMPMVRSGPMAARPDTSVSPIDAAKARKVERPKIRASM